MQLTTTALAFLTATSLTAAAPLTSRQETCPVVQSGDYVWKISEFYARKPDGKSINSIGFNIKATNAGTLDFNCSASADTVADDTFYECGENSQIYFAFQSDRNGLLLKQKVSDDITYVATTTLPNYCRAGGNGPNDFVCQGVSDAYITLVQLPKEA
ncbi:Alternaria Alternata allergen Alt A 1 [Setomelanomma holmii]|uniref:Alternaria Alternata allergen Alt A 1 n=1 Tax=Setomelanomma holmii TaxID=210430 RepID=A0A9P4H0K3_9PLEO|nr:Alternaria Alternata allergen Alt A 1 [Setomelanomma holmii]